MPCNLFCHANAITQYLYFLYNKIEMKMSMGKSMFFHFGLLCFISMAVYTDSLAVMSVDFGSEFMKIAIVKPGVPMEIVLNKESLRKTATIVSLKDGERSFGDPALSASIRFPKTAYRYLLDVLGKHFDNPLVEQYRRRFPFYDLEKDPETGAVLFKHEDGAVYSVEQLIAMILQKAKEYSETFAEQPITEAVITVPPYFNQAERRAMLRAGELAGLKVLQLINDNTAVALNYGVFRRNVFNTTALNFMFFDIGASSTTATIVAYQIVKSKSPTSGVVDTFPQLTIKGVGFDRTLGGLEFQLRLRDHLVEQFNAMKKTKNDVRNDPRAMQKLYKEAGRLKQVLSANVDHFAQVESLLDDIDFRVKVTREDYEALCTDLFGRIDKVIKDALATAQMGMDEISEVILMGAGTRIPKIQEALKKSIQREELGKGINTDEAAALGAVYQAAHLGKGFKVKKFAIKEATIYPIQVEFERVQTGEDNVMVSRTVKRVLFGRMQPYPQKKVMTFNKHVKDFTFNTTYDDLSFLDEQEHREFGSTSLLLVSLSGVEEAHGKHDQAEAKGVKAHFRMDDSGVLYLDKVEAIFDKSVPVDSGAEESTLSKIGNTISNLFGGGKMEEKEGNVEDSKEEPPTPEDEDKGKVEPGDEKSEIKDPPPQPATTTNETVADEGSPPEKEDGDNESKRDEEKPDEPSDKAPTPEEKREEGDKASEADKDAKKDDAESKDESDKKDAEKKEKEEKKPKLLTVKEDIKAEIVIKDLPEPSKDTVKQAKKLMDDLKKKEEEESLLAKVKNEIEAFIFDTQDKLEQKDYVKCSTKEERITIQEQLSTANDWLAEQEETTPRKDYESKLKDLKSVTKDLFGRIKELQDRPAAIETLNMVVNYTEYFLTGMKNYTGEDKPFTEVELEALQKLVVETKEWNKTMSASQAKTPLTEKPKFTAEDVGMKIAALDREVKYLMNKAKSFRPKPKPKPKETNKTESAANDTKTAANDTKPIPDESPDKSKAPDIEIDVTGKDSKLDEDILTRDDDEASVEAEQSEDDDSTTTTPETVTHEAGEL